MKKLILILLIIIMLLPMVSAFGEVKEFTKELGDSYGSIAIYDWFKLPSISSKVADYKLVSNTDYCIIHCSADGIVQLNKDSVLFDGLRFVDGNVKSSNVYIVAEVKQEEYDVIDYEEVCKSVYVEVNKSDSKICSQVEVGSHKESRDVKVYEQYYGQVLRSGVYEWRIEGIKDKDVTVDWIVNVKGLEFDEWAIWNSTFSNELSLYYDFDGLGEKVYGIWNLTNRTGFPSASVNVTFSTSNCLIGTCGQFDGSTKSHLRVPQNNSVTNLGNTNLPRTLNFWFRRTKDANSELITRCGNDACGTADGYLALTPAYLFIADGNWNVNYNTAVAQKNTWVMVTYVKNSTGVGNLFINGTRVKTGTEGMIDGNTPYIIGAYSDGVQDNFGGQMDEMGWWNRTLSDGEITDLYNAGAGMTYTTQFGNPLSITTTLISPANNTNYSVTSATFSANATATNGNVTNMTLYIWNATGGQTTNSTTGLTGTFNSTSWIQSGLVEGINTWNVLSCGTNSTSSACAFNTNRTFRIDTTAPLVSIIYPTAVNYSTNVSELNFTASDTNPGKCNMSVSIGTANSSILNYNLNFTNIISSEGTNIWYLSCNDTFGNTNSTSVTFFKDTVYPLIDWDANGNKASGTITTGYTIPMNVTLTETNFKNITYITSEPRTDVFTSPVTYNSNVVLTGDGIYYYNVTACDTVNNCNQTSTRNITFDNAAPSIIIVSPNGSYNIPPSDNVSLNYTAADLTPITCWYSRNGQSNISLPSCANASVGINQMGWNNWTVYVNDSAGFLSQNSTTFHALGTFRLCNDTITQLSMNFSTYDEETLLPVNGSTFSGNVFYYISDKLYNQTYVFNNYSGLIGNFKFCIYPNWSSMKTSFDSQYSASGYSTRNYQTLNNIADNITDIIPLYMLNSSSTGNKILVAKILDSNLVPQKNIAVQLLRYYPAINTWLSIQHDVSDELGQTIFNVIENFVNYKFVLSQNGVIVYTTDTVKVVCYAVPCSIELTIPSASADIFQYYTNASNVSYSLQWDNNTQIVSLLFSSISGSQKTMQLKVQHINLSSQPVVCNNFTTGVSGLMTCNLSGYSSDFYAQAYVNNTAGQMTILDRISISTANFFRTTGKEGLFWAILLIITLVFVGIWNPTISLILMMTGFITLAITGIISLPWFALASIIILGGYVIYQLKT